MRPIGYTGNSRPLKVGLDPALWGNLLARASNARQPAVLNILCALGGLG